MVAGSAWATAQSIAMGGSVATAALITGSAAAVLGSLGTLLGAQFDKCKTDEERLVVIFEEISRREAELSIQLLNPYLKINLREILELAILFLRNFENQEELEIFLVAKLEELLLFFY